jgi:hypothetical protein
VVKQRPWLLFVPIPHGEMVGRYVVRQYKDFAAEYS